LLVVSPDAETISSPTPSAVVYESSIEGPAGFESQYVFHHGAASSVGVKSPIGGGFSNFADDVWQYAYTFFRFGWRVGGWVEWLRPADWRVFRDA
jgi:hypothetical protein